MELEVFFVKAVNSGYAIGVYDRYTDTLFRLTDIQLEQGLRANKYTVDTVQLKDNKIDLSKALEVNPNNKSVVYKQNNSNVVYMVDNRLLSNSISIEFIKKNLDDHSMLDMRTKVTEADMIKAKEIAKEYDKFTEMTRLLGTDKSFKYVIINGKCILTEYIGTSKDFNVPNFVDYITSSAFNFCTTVNIRATESLKGIGDISHITGKVLLADTTYIAHERLWSN